VPSVDVDADPVSSPLLVDASPPADGVPGPEVGSVADASACDVAPVVPEVESPDAAPSSPHAAILRATKAIRIVVAIRLLAILATMTARARACALL